MSAMRGFLSRVGRNASGRESRSEGPSTMNRSGMDYEIPTRDDDDSSSIRTVLRLKQDECPPRDATVSQTSRAGYYMHRSIPSDEELLREAANYGDVAQVIYLLEKGVDIDAVGPGGETALHLAAKWGKNQVAKILLDKRAGVDAADSNGLTPLSYAALT